MSTRKKGKITAKEFDAMFDKGEDLSEFMDITTVKAHYPVQRVSIDFTKNMLDSVDHEAARIGVTRTALIKVWLSERIEHLRDANY